MAPSKASRSIPSATPSAAPQTFTDTLPLPKLLVFDLDYTLWPFWIDTHVSPPLKPLPTSHASFGQKVKDSYGGTYGFYKDVPGILRSCRDKGILVGAASRTYTPELARELLGMLYVPEQLATAPAPADGEQTPGQAGSSKPARKAHDYFDAMQIFPGNKVGHLSKLSKQLGIAYADILFFDDEERNRNVERELGVCFWLVRDGVTRAEIDRGVEKWRKDRGIAAAGGKKEPWSKRGVDVSLVDDDDDENV